MDVNSSIRGAILGFKPHMETLKLQEMAMKRCSEIGGAWLEMGCRDV